MKKKKVSKIKRLLQVKYGLQESIAEEICQIFSDQLYLRSVEIDKLKHDRFQSDNFNAILGGLKTCIDSHGPITRVHMGSAAKRIYGQLTIPK